MADTSSPLSLTPSTRSSSRDRNPRFLDQHVHRALAKAHAVTVATTEFVRPVFAELATLLHHSPHPAFAAVILLSDLLGPQSRISRREDGQSLISGVGAHSNLRVASLLILPLVEAVVLD